MNFMILNLCLMYGMGLKCEKELVLTYKLKKYLSI